MLYQSVTITSPDLPSVLERPIRKSAHKIISMCLSVIPYAPRKAQIQSNTSITQHATIYREYLVPNPKARSWLARRRSRPTLHTQQGILPPRRTSRACPAIFALPDPAICPSTKI